MLKKITCFIFCVLFLISCAHISTPQNVQINNIDGLSITNLQNTNEDSFSKESLSKNINQISRKHQNSILNIKTDFTNNFYISSSIDGYIARHNIDGTINHWQISDLSIPIIAIDPSGNLIAAYETDRFNVHKVSVWDWQKKERIFIKRFTDSILSLSWSANGTWLFIGNTSIQGITAFETKTWTPRNLFNISPGIVSLAATGESESSVITYGPSGHIIYTDLKTGEIRANFETLSGLSDTFLFSNNSKIAGILDNTIYILEATSGKIINTFNSINPHIIEDFKNTNLFWVDSNNEYYVLYEQDMEIGCFALPENEQLEAIIKFNNFIILGGSTGNTYTINIDNLDKEITFLISDSVQSITKIEDIALFNNTLYFVATNGIFYIDNENGKPNLFSINSTNNNIYIDSIGLVTYSSKNIEPLQLYNIASKEITTLMMPHEPIKSISIKNNKIAFLEGNNRVRIIDEKGKDIYSYIGAGFQDILFINDSLVIISKSSTMRSPTSLLLANIITGETVPLSIEGDLCYGLNYTKSLINKFNGILINNFENQIYTNLVEIELNLNKINEISTTIIAKIADEDLSAFVTNSETNTNFTTLGKQSLIEINQSTNKQFLYQRGSSLPKKIITNNDYAYTLNYDGSISTYNIKTKTLNTTEYINDKNQWITVYE